MPVHTLSNNSDTKHVTICNNFEYPLAKIFTKQSELLFKYRHLLAVLMADQLGRNWQKRHAKTDFMLTSAQF